MKRCTDSDNHPPMHTKIIKILRFSRQTVTFFIFFQTTITSKHTFIIIKSHLTFSNFFFHLYPYKVYQFPYFLSTYHNHYIPILIISHQIINNHPNTTTKIINFDYNQTMIIIKTNFKKNGNELTLNSLV